MDETTELFGTFRQLATYFAETLETANYYNLRDIWNGLKNDVYVDAEVIKAVRAERARIELSALVEAELNKGGFFKKWLSILRKTKKSI
jgi:hypothetical protein